MAESLLTVAQVAELFAVEPSSVTRWVRLGKLSAVRTPGGADYRFRRSDIEALIAEPRTESAAS